MVSLFHGKSSHLEMADNYRGIPILGSPQGGFQAMGVPILIIHFLGNFHEKKSPSSYLGTPMAWKPSCFSWLHRSFPAIPGRPRGHGMQRRSLRDGAAARGHLETSGHAAQHGGHVESGGDARALGC